MGSCKHVIFSEAGTTTILVFWPQIDSSAVPNEPELDCFQPWSQVIYSTLTEVGFGRLRDSRSNSGMIESIVLSPKKLLISYFRFYLPRSPPVGAPIPDNR